MEKRETSSATEVAALFRKIRAIRDDLDRQKELHDKADIKDYQVQCLIRIENRNSALFPSKPSELRSEAEVVMESDDSARSDEAVRGVRLLNRRRRKAQQDQRQINGLGPPLKIHPNIRCIFCQGNGHLWSQCLKVQSVYD